MSHNCHTANVTQVILSSEASKQAAINEAMGEAQAITARAQATAAGIRMVAAELGTSGGASAAQLRVAEQYVEVGAAGSLVLVVFWCMLLCVSFCGG
jgi:regulator of protease activity HflC (stomatin/prohibitin superfamily)